MMGGPTVRHVLDDDDRDDREERRAHQQPTPACPVTRLRITTADYVVHMAPPNRKLPPA